MGLSRNTVSATSRCCRSRGNDIVGSIRGREAVPSSFYSQHPICHCNLHLHRLDGVPGKLNDVSVIRRHKLTSYSIGVRLLVLLGAMGDCRQGHVEHHGRCCNPTHRTDRGSSRRHHRHTHQQNRPVPMGCLGWLGNQHSRHGSNDPAGQTHRNSCLGLHFLNHRHRTRSNDDFPQRRHPSHG